MNNDATIFEPEAGKKKMEQTLQTILIRSYLKGYSNGRKSELKKSESSLRGILRLQPRVKISPTTDMPLTDVLFEMTDKTEPVMLHNEAGKYAIAKWFNADECSWTQNDVKAVIAVEDFYGD